MNGEVNTKVSELYLDCNSYFKGALKSHFTHYLCVVIFFFNNGLHKSPFST